MAGRLWLAVESGERFTIADRFTGATLACAVSDKSNYEIARPMVAEFAIGAGSGIAALRRADNNTVTGWRSP